MVVVKVHASATITVFLVIVTVLGGARILDLLVNAVCEEATNLPHRYQVVIGESRWGRNANVRRRWGRNRWQSVIASRDTQRSGGLQVPLARVEA